MFQSLKNKNAFYFKLILLALSFSLYSNAMFGFDGKIKISRICINQLDSTVTLFTSNISNPCGTFDSIVVYSRIQKTNPDAFAKVLLNTTLLGSSEISIKQPDLRQREYYIRYYTKCDNISFSDSDTLIIDLNPPVASPIDSVSVDIASQKVRIGWTANPSPDLMGYLVFERVGINNIQLNNQRTTSFLDLNSSPNIGAATYTYNSFDSCDNKTILADYHSTMHLSQRLDLCANTLTLSWSSYIGWNTRMYYIYLNINGAGYQLIDSTTSLNYVFRPTATGANHCFYIRASKEFSTITSSSNRVCSVIPLKITPQNSHIKSLQVNGDNAIRINWFASQVQMVKSALLYRGTSLNSLAIVGNIPFTEGANTYIDNGNITTALNPYYYKIVLTDSCNARVDSSAIHKSIFLKIEDKMVMWNSYVFGQSSFDRNIIQVDSSTWNSLNINTIQGDSEYDISLTDSGFCYRILSVSDQNDTSISNVVCIAKRLVFGLPNALRTSSSNPNNRKFYIIGSGVDWDKTVISIFNRWGGKIFELNKSQKEWDGTFQGELVPSEIYLYTGKITGSDKSIHNIKGQITIIR